jgi:hypothetical protein
MTRAATRSSGPRNRRLKGSAAHEVDEDAEERRRNDEE